ncbi:MAG TPA: hypothetical protein VJ201_02860 [Candidatus Babeliales bacterium]|nr:hypothetical protein [Candidatus Babeliales bacterium]
MESTRQSPDKKTRTDKINSEARNKTGQEFSLSYTKVLALCSGGVSSTRIERAFEKQCQNSDRDKCFINKIKLFHELAKQSYISAGILLVAIGCMFYGLHHSVTSGWLK